mgnify:CR=1 FL=1
MTVSKHHFDKNNKGKEWVSECQGRVKLLSSQVNTEAKESAKHSAIAVLLLGGCYQAG